MDEITIRSLGYSELYEWETPDVDNRFGRFVTFSHEHPDKIVNYGDNDTDILLGVTTINSTIDSDDPTEWIGRYKSTDIGDLLLTTEELAVGVKQYDENLEMSFIKTQPWSHYIRIENDEFDETKKYVRRTNRTEWVRVNLLGKVLVYDNGKCEPGGYCKPYVGKIIDKYGTAVPATKNDNNSFYVISRISEDVIMIVNK